MRHTIVSSPFILGIFLLACGEANSPTGPQAASGLLLAPAVGSTARQTPALPGQQQVTGHVDAEFEFFTAIVNQYSFSAIRRRDGSFTGQFEFRAKYNDLVVRVHGDVLCLFIAGNRARVGGIVTKTTFDDGTPIGDGGLPVGDQLTWSVTDGPHNDDTASMMLGSNALNYCRGGLPYAEHPIIRGSVQIHP